MSKEGVQDIIRIFTEENAEICFVGGCIRDALAGLQSYDFDFAVNCVPEETIKALDKKSTIRQTYKIGGEHSFSFQELVSIIAMASGKKKWKIPTPVFPLKMVASVFDQFSWFPITGDQLSMLMEGNTCESKKLFEEFHIEPINFSESNLSYLHSG